LARRGGSPDYRGSGDPDGECSRGFAVLAVDAVLFCLEVSFALT
jgi:hypothetical protein